MYAVPTVILNRYFFVLVLSCTYNRAFNIQLIIAAESLGIPPPLPDREALGDRSSWIEKSFLAFIGVSIVQAKFLVIAFHRKLNDGGQVYLYDVVSNSNL